MPIETAVQNKNEARAERELRKVIRKLRRWVSEIKAHHNEIAKRNFAIGLEIAGFIESFPPRQYPGMELMERLAGEIGFSSSYLSLLARISSWLYDKKGVKAVLPYMERNGLHNWRGVMDHYFQSQGRDEARVMLSRRWFGAKSSLTNLQAALPATDRPVIDRMLGRINKIVKAHLSVQEE